MRAKAVDINRSRYVRRRSYLITILATLGFLAAGLVFILYAGSQSTQETLQYISEAVQQSRHNIDTHIDEEFQSIRTGMVLDDNRSWLADDASFDRLARRLQGNNTYTRVGVVDTGGNALWTNKDGSAVRANLMDQEFIQRALEGHNAISEPRWDSASGTYVNDYAVPAYAADGTLRGAVFVSDPESELRAIMENSLFAGEGFAQIITNDGGYVVKSESPLRLAGDDGIFDLTTPIHPDVQQKMLADMAAGRAGYLEHDFNGDKRMVAYAPSRYNGWFVFYSAYEDAVNAGLSNIIYGAVAIIAIAGGVFLFFVLMIRHNNNKSLEELERFAFVDPMTGGRTMRKFMMDAQRLMESKPCAQHAVCYIDIKGFKYINDLFGRAVGDQLLQYFYDLLKETLSPGELCARAGGDKFVALRCFENMEAMERDDDAFEQRLSAFPPTAAHGYKVEAYGGVYLINPQDGPLSLNDMLDRAMEAAQEAKRAGGVHRFAFYSNEMRMQKLWDAEVESKMDRALEDHEFKMFLQPKINIQRGNILVSMEALVRWEPPGHAMIPPSKFIDLFERNGFIVKLDRYMLEEACRTYRDKGFETHDPPLVLSVNVSRRSLMQPDIVEDYAAIKERYGIPDGLIELEFTEGLLFGDHQRFQQVVDGMRQNGFFTSLDDFGAGYSSLNMLKSLRVDVLKLDRLFFNYGDDEARGRALVKAIIALARTLKIKTVAEGVEDMDEVDWLRRIGCDAIQGYVYSRPLPVEDFVKFSEEWKGKA